MYILLAGGITEDKYEKVAENLRKSLEEKGVYAEVHFLNIYENKQLHDLQGEIDLIVTLSPAAFQTEVPMINGMGLLYPWMGYDEVIHNILELTKK